MGFPGAVVRRVLGDEMMKIDTFFDDDGKERIRRAISEAESSTSAEIVPVLTDSSGRYDRAEDLVGGVAALGLMSLCWLGVQGVSMDGSWQTQRAPELELGLGMIVLILTFGFATGAFLASRIWWLRRLFCFRSEMEGCLKERAMQAFQMYRIGKTQEATGVLIFISSFERMVYVLGDAEISQRLSDDDFVEVKDAIVEGFRQGEYADGLVNGIRLCGQKLSSHFPLQPGDQDELFNELIIWKQGL